MQALTFKRGVHPDDCKRFTADKPIEVVLPKENSEMFYPMSQHIGAPCEPIVAVGERYFLTLPWLATALILAAMVAGSPM